MNGPALVCCGCGAATPIARSLCERCLAELVRTRSHVPFEWRWCEPSLEYVDSDTGCHVFLHNQVH